VLVARPAASQTGEAPPRGAINALSLGDAKAPALAIEDKRLDRQQAAPPSTRRVDVMRTMPLAVLLTQPLRGAA